jgi:transcriptional regulator with XRE-family HTH domain
MMTKTTQILAREIGELLTSYRKKSHLTQAELAKRLGLSSKSGVITISRLEKGKFKNLTLDLILGYLNICEKPWSAFFEKLAGIYFNKQHERIIGQVPTTRFYKKIDRDVAKYTHSIQTKFSVKQGIKPLPQQQKEKMAVDFGKHRAVIEGIEREATILLGDSQEPFILNHYYKAFARECYSAIKKLTTKEISADSASSALNIKLSQIIEKWIKKGLKRDILEKIKEIPIQYLPQSHSDTENK